MYLKRIVVFDTTSINCEVTSIYVRFVALIMEVTCPTAARIHFAFRGRLLSLRELRHSGSHRCLSSRRTRKASLRNIARRKSGFLEEAKAVPAESIRPDRSRTAAIAHVLANQHALTSQFISTMRSKGIKNYERTFLISSSKIACFWLNKGVCPSEI